MATPIPHFKDLNEFETKYLTTLKFEIDSSTW